MSFVKFTELCKDLQFLLINDYVDPKVSMLFLRVNKEYNQKLDRDKIIYRYLKQRSYEDQIAYMHIFFGKIAHCEKCNLVLEKNKLSKHMAKHKKVEERNKPWRISYARPRDCDLCLAPYANFFNHNCLLRKTICGMSSLTREYPYVESTCQKREFYILETCQHRCFMRCEACQEELAFKTLIDENGFGTNTIIQHVPRCPKKERIIAKYGLKYRKVIGGILYLCCYFCDKNTPECQCLCKICNVKKHATNRVITNNETYFLCIDCAKCSICQCDWLGSGPNRVWNFNESPICGNCSNEF